MFTRTASFLTLVVLLAAPRLAFAQDIDEEKDLELTVGEQIAIPATGVKQYSEGAGGIVDVRLPSDGSQFLIVGMKPGTTTLMLIMRDGRKVRYTIKVSPQQVTTVTEKENIRLDFYFVELSENASYNIGIGWPGSIGGDTIKLSASYDLIAGEFTTAQALLTNQALPRLDILQTTGWARIARQAALITTNGTQALYFSGGEVNVMVQGALAAEIRRIEFGSSVQVLPRYDLGTGRMELQIVADVSDLSDDRGTGVPGRTVSKLNTIVNLEPGQAVMLAGLSGRTEGKSKTGLPLLSQIPILGVLFGTHNKRSEATQNVLFIIPTVVDPVSMRGRERISEALRVFNSYEGDLESVDLIGPPPKARKSTGD